MPLNDYIELPGLVAVVVVVVMVLVFSPAQVRDAETSCLFALSTRTTVITYLSTVKLCNHKAWQILYLLFF